MPAAKQVTPAGANGSARRSSRTRLAATRCSRHAQRLLKPACARRRSHQPYTLSNLRTCQPESGLVMQKHDLRLAVLAGASRLKRRGHDAGEQGRLAALVVARRREAQRDNLRAARFERRRQGYRVAGICCEWPAEGEGCVAVFRRCVAGAVSSPAYGQQWRRSNCSHVLRRRQLCRALNASCLPKPIRGNS